MRRSLAFIIGFVMAIFLAACSTSTFENSAPKLLENLSHPDIIKFPLATTAHGRWVVRVDVGDGKMADMVLDTGATYSAFFEDAATKFELPIDTDNVTRIHGLVTNALAATTTIERLGFGQDYFINKNFAVLPASKIGIQNEIKSDGIIGMDIIDRYRIFVDVSDSQIYFIPSDLPDFQLPLDMKSIPLFSNPYVDTAPRLHFFSLGVESCGRSW